METEKKSLSKKSGKLVGARIYLKLLTSKDVTESYVNWMRDKEILRFLESRWTKYAKRDIRKYVRQTNSTGTDYLFGIFLKDSNAHIGNIKIGSINRIHRFADIGLLIGEKKVWGKGYGSEAIVLATRHALNNLGINKITAGIYANNIGSYKAFIKSGYREVGHLINHRLYHGKYIDEILVEKGKEH